MCIIFFLYLLKVNWVYLNFLNLVFNMIGGIFWLVFFNFFNNLKLFFFIILMFRKMVLGCFLIIFLKVVLILWVFLYMVICGCFFSLLYSVCMISGLFLIISIFSGFEFIVIIFGYFDIYFCVKCCRIWINIKIFFNCSIDLKFVFIVEYFV